MRHPPQLRWQQKVFEDVLKERRYQDRQWGLQVDDTLNTPWMWCAYICSYATKWMQNPHRWTREDTEEFYDRMIQTSAIAAAAAESVLRQRATHGKTFYESDPPPEEVK
jgi:hypothetical protein